MTSSNLPFRKAGEPIGTDRIREYERRKQLWLDEQLKQPLVTPGAYEKAVKRIARECGI